VSCRGAQINVAPQNPERADIRDGLQQIFTKAAAVHCVSVAIRDEASKYGLDPARSVVIYPAVDQNFFFPDRRLAENSDRFRLITTARSYGVRVTNIYYWQFVICWIEGYRLVSPL
jgi:hypothetical protein